MTGAELLAALQQLTPEELEQLRVCYDGGQEIDTIVVRLELDTLELMSGVSDGGPVVWTKNLMWRATKHSLELDLQLRLRESDGWKLCTASSFEELVSEYPKAREQFERGDVVRVTGGLAVDLRR